MAKKQQPQSFQLQPFSPRTEAQRRYYSQLKSQDLIFGIGPAGTGKTFCAAHLGCTLVGNGTLSRYVIIRPAVCVEDEEVGFLPGGLGQKMEPFMKPVMEEITSLIGVERTKTWLDHNNPRIEFCPIAFIRGRNFNNAFVHVTEAQNLTRAQAQAIVTRVGEGSRLVIEGDPDQTDKSGVSFFNELVDMAGRNHIPHGLSRFAVKDVVRSELTRRWIEAFAA